jgi:protein SCO1/2
MTSGYYDKLPRCYPTGDIFPYKDALGRIKYDSVYHMIADFKLTNQNGEVITNRSLDGRIYVANFFFTTCRSICPRMTNLMKVVYDKFRSEDAIRFLSHTVDPENDSVPVLRSYGRENKINSDKWFLLTGTRQALYELSKKSYYLGVASDDQDNFTHSEKFVLVDTHRVIRGFYNGTDSAEVNKLTEDIEILLREIKQQTE